MAFRTTLSVQLYYRYCQLIYKFKVKTFGFTRKIDRQHPHHFCPGYKMTFYKSNRYSQTFNMPVTKHMCLTLQNVEIKLISTHLVTLVCQYYLGFYFPFRSVNFCTHEVIEAELQSKPMLTNLKKKKTLNVFFTISGCCFIVQPYFH